MWNRYLKIRSTLTLVKKVSLNVIMTSLYLTIVFVVISACGIFGESTINDTFNSTRDNTQVKLLNETHEESEFPQDLFTEQQRKNGAIILHIILAVYCFVTIATVCTEYFLPTIARICHVLKLSDDVAAATFMSIATSSPELFTNIIGTFLTNSDIGVGHVLGNAYYDMFFVAALGGFAASKDILLDWWPITRDCIFYLVVAITLTWVVWDGQIEMYETLVLLSLYILYFIVMFGNRKIIRFLRKHFNIDITDPVEENENQIMRGRLQEMAIPEQELLQRGDYKLAPLNEDSLPEPHIVMQMDKKTFLAKLGTCLIFPLTLMTSLTIPDVKKDDWRKNLYPVSFVMCVCWIGVSTYLGTWMISVIGETVGIPDIIMGMVFMAAGGSVVEAYGVFYKARRGECSIGLSNSMGCNTLDATMCLGLPWLVKCLIYTGTGSSAIALTSGVLHINCTLLVISVIVIYAILYLNSFQLNWKLGIFAGISYITVLSIAITGEYRQGSVES